MLTVFCAEIVWYDIAVKKLTVFDSKYNHRSSVRCSFLLKKKVYEPKEVAV